MASAVDTHRAVGGGETATTDAHHHAAGTAPADAAPCPPRRDHDYDHDHDHDGEADLAVSSTLSPSSVTSPPYWLNSGAHAHQRSTSNLSADSVLPAGAITLRDNDTSEHDDRNAACWAKSVEIVDYTTVNGSATNIGAFVVWTVRVETLNGSYMNIRKRYSEFDELRRQLIQSFPNFEAAVPVLPPKSVISKFRPRFLDKRRAGLQYFLNCIMLNPEFSGSPVLKEFLFR
ncbi:PX domain-containing protein YPT35 [Tolypocladium ophioglossoides CBS 100239]|uniref:Endosomal/vacuolar adapter protein YPT35 n=1 Tax=Tolypocladium ophioglossoides (strain CBS 100239) TaxID=1163406 RepID=A0A0L0NAI9_TOLOC|nr:PX domain-containing protein YPT35 [Tolypocladium ophioglossoides CBS 100239]